MGASKKQLKYFFLIVEKENIFYIGFKKIMGPVPWLPALDWSSSGQFSHLLREPVKGRALDHSPLYKIHLSNANNLRKIEVLIGVVSQKLKKYFNNSVLRSAINFMR